MFPRFFAYIHWQKELNLSNKRIGDRQAKQIGEELASNTTLKRLDVCGSRIGNDGVVAIAIALRTNQSLEELDLGFNKFGDLGTAAIAQALKQNNSLKALYLNGNKIFTFGLTRLADTLKTNTGLKTLWLSCCSIDDEEAAILADALKINTTLATLYLLSNGIGAVGAQAILVALKEYNTTLTYLNLEDNREISPALRSAIESVVQANKAGTRSAVPLIFGGLPVQSNSTIASVEHRPLQETKSESLPSASAKAGPRTSPPTAPTPVSSPPATTAPWPKQRAELEFEIQRLTAVRDACLATTDKNQWQQGLAAENAILRMQNEVLSGKYPTSGELQSMVNGLINEIRQTVGSDSLAAAVPLRDRLEQLQADLAREREAEERVRQTTSKNTETDLIGVGRRSVLAALHSTEPSDEIGPVPVDYLASITSHWTDVVGSGGFGVVFRGQDAVSGVVVAVKKIPNDRLHENEKKQFKNEIAVRAQLIRIHEIANFSHLLNSFLGRFCLGFATRTLFASWDIPNRIMSVAWSWSTPREAHCTQSCHQLNSRQCYPPTHASMWPKL
jgi:Leucine Rich repeat